MRTTPVRIALVLAVFIAALGGALLLLQARNDTPDRPAAAHAAGIWKVGDSWTIKVRQDAGAITPSGVRSVAEIPFRFEVTDAPAARDGSWTVHVEQDGAEGPFAAGWRLEYRLRDGRMELHRVAVGEEPPLEAALAGVVLGPQFPYETSYDAPPKDATLDAGKLLERNALPPSALPGDRGSTPPAAPPASAPRLEPGGAPVGRG